MDLNQSAQLENVIFSYIDEFKILFFPGQWSEVFLDYSKNEILALLCIYRRNNANMTEIADYIMSPLNTATGVVGRLEKKQLVERIRNSEDRRIVEITLTDTAKKIIEKEKTVIINYLTKVYGTLTEEEISAALSIYKKVLAVFRENKNLAIEDEIPVKKVKKIIIE